MADLEMVDAEDAPIPHFHTLNVNQCRSLHVCLSTSDVGCNPHF